MTQKIVFFYSLFFLFSINLSAQLVYSLDVTAPSNQPNVAKFLATGTTTNGGTAVTGDASSFASNNGIGGYFVGGDKGLSAATTVQDLTINGSAYAIHAVNSTSGNGARYGVYSFMNIDAAADGKHYGFYTSVNPTAGEDYGIYAVCGGEDDWAGYFLGAGYFEAKPWMVGLAKKQPLEVNADIPPSDLDGLDGYKGLLIYYKDNSDWGGSLVARETMEGGFNVGRGQGSRWAPLHALDYVVQTNDFSPSEDDSKKNMKRKDRDDYMQSIRAIKVTNVNHTEKNYLKPSAKRLGIDMASFPENLQIEEHTTTEGIGATSLVVSLVDWTSLLTLGVKENDQKVQELTAENVELKEKLASLEQEMAAIHQLLANNNSLNIPTENTIQTAVLANEYLVQNAPNPFHSNTTIHYQLPADTQTAQLKISDAQGTIIKVITLNNNSQGQVELQKGTLAAGNYQYSLVVDGKVLATKQMILTK